MRSVVFGVGFCSLILLSCKITHNTFEHPDPGLVSVVNQSLIFFGGLDKYRAITSLSYDKKVNLYLEDGSLERSIREDHFYDFENSNYVILRKVGIDLSRFLFQNGEYLEIIEGDTIHSARAKKTFDTAFYVTGMPFKFLDAGTQMKLMKKQDNNNVIQVEYNSAAYENHSSDETWYYFVDEKSGNLTQQIAHTSDHISLIKNESYHYVDGFRFINLRTSYRVNDAYEILYKRADYDYSGLKVKF